MWVTTVIQRTKMKQTKQIVYKLLFGMNEIIDIATAAKYGKRQAVAFRNRRNICNGENFSCHCEI